MADAISCFSRAGRGAFSTADATTAGVDVPDRYVFGYGMDYNEQGRNLPAIYALKD